MKDQPAPDSDALASSGVHRVEDVCDRFEAAWKGAAATAPPRPEDYLTAVPEGEHAVLLRELIALDIAYRCRRGERPALPDYQLRFPGQAALVQAVFLTVSPPPPPGDRGEPATPPRPRAGTPAGSDRNLLFGILALQMDFISREILIAAMHAWVLDKAKSLGQILVEQQALNPDEQAVLEALVQKHLQRHGNNPEQSLAALPAPAALAEELRSLNDGDLQASLDSIAHAGETDPAATIAHVPKAAARPGDGLRYRILRPHAKGGLGEVFVAMDEELHREVALKEIQERYADDEQSQGRFFQEAEITSGLEHPGVVPVYGFGRYPDGRPFYAMRLIQGDSLKDAIQRFHKADGPARDPGERSLALHQLLRRFLDVCNAIAYAHSRGILHRDLKPANVMLGKYGETLVVDWGLAKPVGRPDSLPASAEVTLRPHSGGVAATQMGAALGTPAYMSPEQASGRLDLLGPASDVYSLGATLYTLLTGEAPFAGSDQGEILDKVRRGDIIPPHQAKEQTPAALASVALRAMALEPKERYATCLDLAADVEHWLADEPVGACPEPWTARLGRWARRHKTAVAGVAILLVTAVVALSISTAVITRAQKQTEEARQQESGQRQRAETSFQTALDAVDQMLTRVGEKGLADVPQMDEVRQKLLEDALKFYQGFFHEGSTDPAVRREVGRAWQRTGRVHLMLGKQAQAEQDYGQALDVQRKLADAFPYEPSYAHDLALSHQALGDLYRAQQGRTPEAERAYQQALEILQPLADAHPEIQEIKNSLAAAQNNLGVTYRTIGRTDQAQSVFQKALDIRYALAGNHPKVAGYQNALAESYESLGDLYRTTGRRSRSEAEFQKAVAIRAQLSRDYPKDPEYQSSLAKSYNKLGYVYEMNGPLAQAEGPYQEAFRICQRLAREHPTFPEYQTALAKSYRDLGRLYFFTGRGVDADSHFQKSADIFKKLISEYPDQVRIALDFADNANQIGVVWRQSGNLKGALPWLEQSIQQMRKVLQKEPRHTEARERLVSTYMDRAEALVRLGLKDDAIKDWDQMIELGKGQTSPHVRMYWAMASAHRGAHALATAEVEALLALGVEPENAKYNFACIYSVSSAAAANDARPSAPERERLAQQYAARAIELLAKARKADSLTIGVDYLKSDTDLDPLRSRDDFKKLIRQLEEEESQRSASGKKGASN